MVFNFPLNDHHILIDLKPLQKYSRGHMASLPRPSFELVCVCVCVCVRVHVLCARVRVRSLDFQAFSLLPQVIVR